MKSHIKGFYTVTDPVIDDILKDIEDNIEKNNFCSLRNAVRGLSDCCKIILSKFSSFYPTLTILEQLQIDKRIDLLIAFDSDIEKYKKDIIIIYELRNKVDHYDYCHPKKEKLQNSLSKLKLFVNQFNDYKNNKQISSISFNVKNKFEEELNFIKNIYEKLNISDIDTQNKIISFESFISHFNSFPSEEKILKFIELDNLQSKILNLYLNNIKSEQSIELEKGMIDWDDYYQVKGLIDGYITNSSK